MMPVREARRRKNIISKATLTTTATAAIIGHTTITMDHTGTTLLLTIGQGIATEVQCFCSNSESIDTKFKARVAS